MKKLKFEKILKKNGYKFSEKLWFSDGLYTMSANRPNKSDDSRSYMPWEEHWIFNKNAGNYSFRMEIKLDTDGDGYYEVGELNCYSLSPRPIWLHNRGDFRGANPRFSICEILEKDLKNLAGLELYLIDCVELAKKVCNQINS